MGGKKLPRDRRQGKRADNADEEDRGDALYDAGSNLNQFRTGLNGPMAPRHAVPYAARTEAQGPVGDERADRRTGEITA